ncbi:MAG TPA: hypothetical protein VGG71_12995 [Chitinophagaceae bacterium]
MIPAVITQRLELEKPELTILKALAYFNIFNYPLTKQEVRNFSGNYIGEERFEAALHKMVFEKIIFRINEFYSLQNDPFIVEKRIKGNDRAKKLLSKAINIGAFLYRFPFVRAVGISGSLSKNYADEKADIDFFIITKSNRLWISRTILHLFKKLTFLVGRQHFFCMNYFIDEKTLQIPQQNIYSATEIVTLLPAAGTEAINDFFKTNDWTDDWLPNASKWKLKISDKDSVFKRSVERIFADLVGDRFDDFLFQWTTKRWQKKSRLGRKNLKGKRMNLVTDKHFSKSDPEAFQAKVVAHYKNKMDEFKDRWPQYFA